MSILADTSGVLALLDPNEPRHQDARPYADALLIPSTILCEVDYLASQRYGSHVARRFLASVAEESVRFLNADLKDVKFAYTLVERYADTDIGFVDASVIALAERHRIRRVLTLDRKHFSFVQAPTLGYLELLP